MRSLFKLVGIVALGFVALFVLVRLTGVVDLEDIKHWLEASKSLPVIYIAALVVGLLVLDLLISIPTLTVTMLAGFYLGAMAGAAAAICGLILAGITGYFISRRWGEAALSFVLKDASEQVDARAGFHAHGFMMIVLSRAVPMLPEVTCCLAGITAMPFGRFMAAWLLNSVPYAILASYAGSISSVDDPRPAIFAAMVLYVALWGGWFFFRKSRQDVSS